MNGTRIEVTRADLGSAYVVTLKLATGQGRSHDAARLGHTVSDRLVDTEPNPGRCVTMAHHRVQAVVVGRG